MVLRLVTVLTIAGLVTAAPLAAQPVEQLAKKSAQGTAAMQAGRFADAIGIY